MNITGKWNGFFTYDETYGEMQGEKGFFEIDIIDNKGDLTGMCRDISGVGISNIIKSKFSGFLENTYINFVKSYDSSHFDYDENTEPYEVKYEGDYSEKDDKFVGSWEIQMDNKEQIDTGENNILLWSGTWEMTKMK
jgi:hypothetical protein